MSDRKYKKVEKNKLRVLLLREGFSKLEVKKVMKVGSIADILYQVCIIADEKDLSISFLF